MRVEMLPPVKMPLSGIPLSVHASSKRGMHNHGTLAGDIDAFHLDGAQLKSLKTRTVGVLVSEQSSPIERGAAVGLCRQRVQRIVQRKQERDSWRTERRHLDALRDPSELTIAGREQQGRHAVGRAHGGKGKRALHASAAMASMVEDPSSMMPADRWRMLNELFRDSDLNRDGTVPNSVFVKVLRGLDLFLGEVRLCLRLCPSLDSEKIF